jgi:uncharacterized protein YodC (DUF2158 family)
VSTRKGHTIHTGDLVTKIDGDGTLMKVVKITVKGSIMCEWEEGKKKRKGSYKMHKLLVVKAAR